MVIERDRQEAGLSTPPLRATVAFRGRPTAAVPGRNERFEIALS